jgi:nitrous oxidase accessory protein
VPENENTIQEAINAAQPGDIIHVASGVYYEHLSINKSVTVLGDDQHTTILAGNLTGILVDISSDNVSLSGFTLRDAEKAIVMTDVQNCQIKGNLIINFSMFNGMGIYAYNCKNITIEGNTAGDVYFNQVYFERTNESLIKNNIFNANSRWSQPLFLRYSNHNVISWNQVLGQGGLNEGGIGLLSSDHNLIMFNEIVENDWAGISLRKSNHTTVEGNTIIGDSFYGLVLTDCENNCMYWNNFISNYQHVYLDSAQNLNWSFGKYGNYWDNYDGKDLDQDGTGDSPYTIDGANSDSHPLMGKFHCYETYKGEEKIQIITISNSTVNDLKHIVDGGYPDGVLKLNVSGAQGTSGFCLVIFPNNLFELPYNVTVNGLPPLLQKDLSDAQAAALYFVYLHESVEENIIIIWEFSNIVILLIGLTLSSLMLVISRRKIKSENLSERH